MRTRLAGLCDFANRSVGVGRVVLGDETDEQAGPQAGADGDGDGVPVDDLGGVSLELHRARQQRHGQQEHNERLEDRRAPQLNLQRGLNVSVVLNAAEEGNVGNDERNNHAGRHDQNREQHDGPRERRVRRQRRRQDHGGASSLSETAEQIGTHTGNVTDIVADVVSDDSWVARIVLRDASLDLADQVSADISSLRVDTATNTPEHGN